MSETEEKFGELEDKLGKIIMRLSDYQQVIRKLKEENAQLKRQKMLVEEELEACKNAAFAPKMTLSEDEKTDIRNEINELVREIDSCIGLIKK